MPWEVWWVNFDPQVGHEQAGIRPGVVVSTKLACRLQTGLVTVVPCTTRKRGLAYQPELSGLPKPCAAMCEQVKTISAARLHRRAPGTVSTEEIALIQRVLRALVEVG